MEAGEKLNELVTNILKLNKLESQEILPISEPYALDEQLRECVLNVEALWDKKNITFVGDDIDEVIVNLEWMKNFTLVTLYDIHSVMEGTTDFIWKFAVLAGVGAVTYLIGSAAFTKRDLPL